MGITALTKMGGGGGYSTEVLKYQNSLALSAECGQISTGTPQ